MPGINDHLLDVELDMKVKSNMGIVDVAADALDYAGKETSRISQRLSAAASAKEK